MKKEWKDKWVAALRSGDYKQGYFDLVDLDNEYCCLGVLCDIVSTSKPVDGNWTEFNESMWNNGLIPDIVGDTTGLDDSKDHHTLVKFNDHNKFSFNDIADYIEEHF
jgi:hypothetical protein